MLTDHEIEDLIAVPKAIVSKTPTIGYREVSGSNRCDLDLQADSVSDVKFRVFIRQSVRYIENFTVGLQYRNDRRYGDITLLRYNGPHGETSRDEDGHYALPHIHRITAAELALGSTQPRETRREITARYGTLEDALIVFFDDTAVSNYDAYFPELRQGRLLDEYQ